MSVSVEEAAPPGAAPRDPPLWTAIRASLRGVRQNYAELPLRRAVILLAVPMALELIMESTFGVVDIFFVGRLGPAAVAAVGLTGSLIMLVFTIAMGLSIGASALVSRRIGEGDEEGARRAAAQAILAGVSFSIPVSAAGWLLAPQMLRWMGASDAVAAGAAYTAILFGSSVTIFLLFLNNAVFRGAGDASAAMRALWLANLFNIVLDPCLIFGLGPFPEMGLEGAAVATALGRGAGVLYQIRILSGTGSRIALRPRHFAPDPGLLRRLLRISSSGMVQFFVATASWVAIMRIIAAFGDAAVAGYTTALILIRFAILPSWGVSNAAATLVGQSLGAGKPERAEEAVWVTVRYNFLFLGGVALAFSLFPGPLIRLFTAEPAVIEAGVTSLRIVSCAYLFWAFSMVFAQAFNGAGDAGTPMMLNLVVMWGLLLPLAWILAHGAGLGFPGALWALVASQAVWAASGAILFRRGRWKAHKV